MAIPTWTVGEVLTASDVNAWFVPQFAAKTSGQTTTGTTLVNDSTLVLPVAASAFYWMDCFLWYDGPTGTSQGLKTQFTGPSGFNFNLGINGQSLAGNDLSIGSFQPSAEPFLTTTAGSANGVRFQGLVTTASTAGNLQLQWALAASSPAGTLTVHSSSYMRLDRVG